MDEKKFICSGDCLQCSKEQRAYCSSQFTYNTLRMVEALQKSVEELSAKVDAMQGGGQVFNPTQEEI